MNIHFDHRVLTAKQANMRRALEVVTTLLLMACAVAALCGFVMRGMAEGWPMDVRLGTAFLAVLNIVFPFWLLPLPSFSNTLDAHGLIRLQQVAQRHPELAEIIFEWLQNPDLELRREDLAACQQYVEELKEQGRATRGLCLQGRVS
jgi:hypothetical protein